MRFLTCILAQFLLSRLLHPHTYPIIKICLQVMKQPSTFHFFVDLSDRCFKKFTCLPICWGSKYFHQSITILMILLSPEIAVTRGLIQYGIRLFIERSRMIWRCKNGVKKFPIALKFGLHLCSSAVEPSTKFQSDTHILTSNLSGLKLRKILRSDIDRGLGISHANTLEIPVFPITINICMINYEQQKNNTKLFKQIFIWHLKTKMTCITTISLVSWDQRISLESCERKLRGHCVKDVTPGHYRK